METSKVDMWFKLKLVVLYKCRKNEHEIHPLWNFMHKNPDFNQVKIKLHHSSPYQAARPHSHQGTLLSFKKIHRPSTCQVLDPATEITAIGAIGDPAPLKIQKIWRGKNNKASRKPLGLEICMKWNENTWREQQKENSIIHYMGVVLNSFFSKRPFLAKKNHCSQTFAISTKNFRLDCIWEFLVGNRSLTRDICASERPSKLSLWRLRIRMWYFAFHSGPYSPSPASSDTSTSKLRAHLLPASLETRHNKSTV